MQVFFFFLYAPADAFSVQDPRLVSEQPGITQSSTQYLLKVLQVVSDDLSDDDMLVGGAAENAQSVYP